MFPFQKAPQKLTTEHVDMGNAPDGPGKKAPSWTNTPCGTMSASVLSKFGQPDPSDCFTCYTQYPKPSLPSKDWVLVRVRAAGLNRAELRARNQEHVSPLEFGIFIDEYHTNHPKILGEDFVGEVEEAGSDSGYKIGDIVCGCAYGGSGCGANGFMNSIRIHF